MRVIVINTLDDLAGDMRAITTKAKPAMRKVVRRNATEGNKLAKQYARQSAGPHGKSYWKRISSEMTGDLSAEYGPTGVPKTDFVGVGFRHGGTNTDLPRSADIQGPKFAKDALDTADGLFW